MSFIVGIGLITLSIVLVILRGGNPAMLFDIRALLLVVCGTLASTLITLPFSAVREQFSAMLAALGPQKKIKELMAEILEYARIARREGVLALEGCEGGVNDRILKKGLVLISDSADHETVRSILQKEAQCMERREKSAQQFLERIATFAPGIGMVGSLIEIVQMLYRYTGPKTLAPEIASALLPVVYGALLAYLVLLPLSARVAAGSEKRMLLRELAVEGVLAIQAGEPIHIVEERLMAFINYTGGESGTETRD